MIANLRVENSGEISTTPDYWDCECEKDYIHEKQVLICHVCGTMPDEQPDSQVNEVEEFLRQKEIDVRLVEMQYFP